jgi:hypothetical protein
MYRVPPVRKPLNPAKPKVEKEEAAAAKRSEEKQLAALVPDTDGWWTRNQVCDNLRCSPQTVKNYEARGLLRPRDAIRKGLDGSDRRMKVYDPAQIVALPARNPGGEPRVDARAPGELAARAFELFRESKTLDEVIIELRETPDRIDHLYEKWLDYSRARHIITPEARDALEKTLGRFEGVSDLVDIAARVMRVLAALGQHLGNWTSPEDLIRLTTEHFVKKPDDPVSEKPDDAAPV